MVAAAINMPTIADFLSANPNAPPNEMLAVVVAETQRLKEENAWIQQEYRQTTEVELDENLNFRPKTMAQLQRLARMYAESGLVPDHYKNNVAGCAIGIQMALRMHVDILTFLQCSFVHKGKIGIEAKLAMARLNTSGKIKGRVTYRIDRDETGKIKSCTAMATDADSNEQFSQTVDWKMVEGEGWHQANGSQKSKWLTLPDLMFQYRSGIFLARVHYPDVLLGMYTIDELEDMARTGESSAPAPAAPSGALAELSERMGASLKPKKPTTTKAPEKTQDDDPFKPSEREAGATPVASRSATPVEPPTEVAKPTVKEGPKAPAAEKQAVKPTEPAKQAGPTAEALRGFMSLNYQHSPDVVDFDVEKIIESCVGISDWRKIIDAIIARKHPEFADYLKAELRPEPTQEAEEAGDLESSEDDTNQDAPEFIARPAPRPKRMDLVPASFEKKIIGKRSPDELRKFVDSDLKGNPDLDDVENAYLTHLALRRAYQLQHNLPRTDKLPE